jgi:hypothetical protein
MMSYGYLFCRSHERDFDVRQMVAAVSSVDGIVQSTTFGFILTIGPTPAMDNARGSDGAHSHSFGILWTNSCLARSPFFLKGISSLI